MLESAVSGPVCKIVPRSPTAQPVLESRKKTSLRVVSHVLSCLTQFDPPFVVLIIFPTRPTTVPLNSSANETPQSHTDGPLTCSYQFAPAFVVEITIPEGCTPKAFTGVG